MNLEQLKKN